jgi:outer membrane protein assembly factor BamB
VVAEADRRGALVRAIHPEHGKLWHLKVPATSSIPGAAHVAIGPRMAIVLRLADSVHGLDPRTGEIRWTRDTHIPNWFRLPVSGLPAPTIAASGLAFVATLTGLVALDAETGEEAFTRSDLATTIPIAVDGGGVAHVAMPGRLVGVDSSGKTVYEVGLPTGGRPPGPPSIGYRGVTFLVGVDEVLGVT